MRPRGLSASLPVSVYVGHAGRHRPQWTQERARVYVRGSSLIAGGSSASATSPPTAVGAGMDDASPLPRPTCAASSGCGRFASLELADVLMWLATAGG